MELPLWVAISRRLAGRVPLSLAVEFGLFCALLIILPAD
jgi:hypothetical protein